MNIPIDHILPNPDQPRKIFNRASLIELAQSIRKNGVIVAVSVEETADGKYILIDGERRLRASKMAGLTEIPATITPYTNGAGTRLMQAMVANLLREDLNPIEEALGYSRLQKEFGMTVNNIALKTGKSRVHIDNSLLLLKLDPDIQDMVAEGTLYKDPRLAKGLLAIDNVQARVQTAREISTRHVRLSTAIKSCEKVNQTLSDIYTYVADEPPAITYARKFAKSSSARTDWNILQQLGKVPPWKVVADSALSTCDNCGIRSVASVESCRECPALDLMRRMLEIGKP